jgi:hypothetical protein
MFIYTKWVTVTEWPIAQRLSVSVKMWFTDRGHLLVRIRILIPVFVEDFFLFVNTYVLMFGSMEINLLRLTDYIQSLFCASVFKNFSFINCLVVGNILAFSRIDINGTAV